VDVAASLSRAGVVIESVCKASVEPPVTAADSERLTLVVTVFVLLFMMFPLLSLSCTCTVIDAVAVATCIASIQKVVGAGTVRISIGRGTAGKAWAALRSRSRI